MENETLQKIGLSDGEDKTKKAAKFICLKKKSFEKMINCLQ